MCRYIGSNRLTMASNLGRNAPSPTYMSLPERFHVSSISTLACASNIRVHRMYYITSECKYAVNRRGEDESINASLQSRVM